MLCLITFPPGAPRPRGPSRGLFLVLLFLSIFFLTLLAGAICLILIFGFDVFKQLILSHL